MFEKKTGRGRPKGSGIDDSARIARLRAILQSNPELKPTTGIRRLGITDPSAIRRIRDKYNLALSREAAAKAQTVAVRTQAAQAFP